MGDLRCAGVLKAALAALLALGGCASSDTTTSGSPADDAARNRATLECMNVAREVKASPQGPRTVVDQDRYQQCMKARGYVTTPTR